MPRKAKAAAAAASATEPPSSPLSTPPASPPQKKTSRKTNSKSQLQPRSRQPAVSLSQTAPPAPYPLDDLPPFLSGTTTLVDSPPRKKPKVLYNSDDEREVDALEVKELDWEALLADEPPRKDRTPESVEPDNDEEKVVEVFRPTKLPDGFELNDTALLVKSQTCWYTGILLEFHPAVDEAARRKYGDQYICAIREEEKPLKRRRKDVCFLGDQEIATVILGDHVTTRMRITCDADSRAVTPPVDPSEAVPSQPTLAPETFADLSLAEQLRVIRPHLERVICEEYTPGSWRANKFFGTPSERNSLIRKVQLGDIHPDHSAEIIVPELRRWALRGDRRAGTAHQRPPEPPRPTGSERYESLSLEMREHYIMDVLLAEAVVQLYIRSRGSDVLLAELADRAPEALDEDEDEDEDEDDILSLNPLQTASINPPRKKRKTRPTADAATDEESRTYAAARKGLKRLRDNDEENKWAMRDQEVKAKRAAARRRLKLPAEGRSEWEKRQARLGAGEEEGWAGGRPRARQNYKED